MSGCSRIEAPATLLVCINRRLTRDKPSCAARGALDLERKLRDRLALECPAVAVRAIHCFGRCDEGPNVRIAPGGPFYRGVGEGDLDTIVSGVRRFLRDSVKNSAAEVSKPGK